VKHHLCHDAFVCLFDDEDFTVSGKLLCASGSILGPDEVGYFIEVSLMDWLLW
jgi:hypothetical protein